MLHTHELAFQEQLNALEAEKHDLLANLAEMEKQIEDDRHSSQLLSEELQHHEQLSALLQNFNSTLHDQLGHLSANDSHLFETLQKAESHEELSLNFFNENQNTLQHTQEETAHQLAQFQQQLTGDLQHRMGENAQAIESLLSATSQSFIEEFQPVESALDHRRNSFQELTTVVASTQSSIEENQNGYGQGIQQLGQQFEELNSWLAEQHNAAETEVHRTEEIIGQQLATRLLDELAGLDHDVHEAASREFQNNVATVNENAQQGIGNFGARSSSEASDFSQQLSSLFQQATTEVNSTLATAFQSPLEDLDRHILSGLQSEATEQLNLAKSVSDLIGSLSKVMDDVEHARTTLEAKRAAQLEADLNTTVNHI